MVVACSYKIFGNSPLYIPLNTKNQSPCIVYGSKAEKKFCGLWTPIRTSDSTDEAKFKKGVFLGHPNDYFMIMTLVQGF